MSIHIRHAKAPKLAQLQLNRETVQDLTEKESDAADGGMSMCTGPGSARCTGGTCWKTGKCK